MVSGTAGRQIDLSGNSKNKKNKSFIAFLALFFFPDWTVQGMAVTSLQPHSHPHTHEGDRQEGNAIWQRIFKMQTQELCVANANPRVRMQI